MADEKKEFEKTKQLTDEEVRDIINTDYGAQLKLKDVKAGHNIVMKITGAVVEGEYEFGGATKKTYNLPCEYKPKECDKFDLKVQVGENAVKRLLDKYPEDKYVGMYAFFSRTAYDGHYPQFINPIPNYTGNADKSDLFTKKSSTDDTAKGDSPSTHINADLEDFSEWSTNYLSSTKEAGIVPTAVHMVGSFIVSHNKELTKALCDKCSAVVKKANEEKKE